jgi:hypothetical protein
VLGDFPGDVWHFCWAPCKHVLVVSKEADELTFLFGYQTGPDLHSFGQVLSINLHGLSVLVHLESARRWGHGQDERLYGCLEAELPQFGCGDQLNVVLLIV